jgi:hypothetical protein
MPGVTIAGRTGAKAYLHPTESLYRSQRSAEVSRQKKVILNVSEMPTHWYNITADLPAAGVELPPPF